jgi:uncharacterized membrane protein
MAIRWLTASDYPDGVFWPLYCLSFSLHLLITPLVSVGHCIVCLSLTYSFWLPRWYLLVIVLSVFQFTASDYPVGIFWPLYCLSFFDLRLLITPLVSFDHCIVCLSVYSFWLSRNWKTDNTMAKRYQRGNQKLQTERQTIHNTMAKRYQRGNQKP